MQCQAQLPLPKGFNKIKLNLALSFILFFKEIHLILKLDAFVKSSPRSDVITGKGQIEEALKKKRKLDNHLNPVVARLFLSLVFILAHTLI